MTQAVKISVHPRPPVAIGQSHWWGNPDFPHGIEYPCRTDIDKDGVEDVLTFICQIRLADIKSVIGDISLPETGILYFFADIDYYLGDYDANSPGIGEWPECRFCVIYASDDSSGLQTAIVVDEDGDPYFPEAQSVTFEPCNAFSDGNKLLGMPFFSDLHDQYPGWISLLQVDSDDDLGVRFYDCGMLNFLIEPEALKTLDFSNVKCVLYSL